VSASLTGSNQLLFGDKRSRSDQTEFEADWRHCLGRGQRQAWRKPTKKESQIVSRRRGINYPPKKLSESPSSSLSRTKKLYEMKAFADPTKEKERQNAINAKKNRDKKKGLESNAQVEINKLRTLNKLLNKEAAVKKRKLFAARKEIKFLKSKLESSSIQAVRWSA
jgi:hypothetical protein